MWKSFSAWVQRQITMAQDITRLQQDVSQLRAQQEDTARTLERLIFTLQRESDQWRHEHANLLLQLEVELLKMRAQLPS